jgi:cytochrome o ubiquinol oxidase operon protein cyoD
MSSMKQPLVSQFEPPHASVRAYVTAFIGCLALTGLAYAAATIDSLDHNLAIAAVASLAILQCLLQLRRFLHLGDEFKPRWKVWIFLTMLSTVLIIVIGSLWIMSNLNYRMQHSPESLNEYVHSQDGL